MEAAAATQAGTIGKAALAALLRWGRPRLDRRLEADAQFPVVKRGDQSGGWEFDPAAVKAYLDGAPSPERSPPAIDQAQLRDAVARPASSPEQPRRSAYHQGEATAKQRYDSARADREEIKALLEAGDLVDKTRTATVVTTMLARLGKGFDGLPEAIRSRLDLPDENRAVIREMCDELRINAVGDLREIFTPTTEADAAVSNASEAAGESGTDRRGSAKRPAPAKAAKRGRSRARGKVASGRKR